MERSGSPVSSRSDQSVLLITSWPLHFSASCMASISTLSWWTRSWWLLPVIPVTQFHLQHGNGTVECSDWLVFVLQQISQLITGHSQIIYTGIKIIKYLAVELSARKTLYEKCTTGQFKEVLWYEFKKASTASLRLQWQRMMARIFQNRIVRSCNKTGQICT